MLLVWWANFTMPKCASRCSVSGCWVCSRIVVLAAHRKQISLDPPWGPWCWNLRIWPPGCCSATRFLRLYRSTDPAGDISVAPPRSLWKLQDGSCEGSTAVYLFCYVCCHGNRRYLDVETREVGGSRPTPTSVIWSLNLLTYYHKHVFPTECQ